jgi:DNA-binding SARP family transcriptional activator
VVFDAEDNNDDELLSFGLMVRVMGPIQFEGCGHIQRTKGREALAFLATHRAGHITGDTLVERLWPGHDAAKAGRNLHQTMLELRAATGLGPAGEAYVPALSGGERQYRLAASVGTDVDVLRAALDRAKARPDAKGRMMLRSALGLVAGVPFDHVGRGYEWAHSEGLVSQVEILVTDACHRLSVMAREAGDYETAEWAAVQGLVLAPGHEQLYRDIMEARAASGNTGGVTRAWDELNDILEADQQEPDAATEAVFRRITGRLARVAS